jgi:hypothetical protein
LLWTVGLRPLDFKWKFTMQTIMNNRFRSGVTAAGAGFAIATLVSGAAIEFLKLHHRYKVVVVLRKQVGKRYNRDCLLTMD